jgi:hypothetical protein
MGQAFVDICVNENFFAQQERSDQRSINSSSSHSRGMEHKDVNAHFN